MCSRKPTRTCPEDDGSPGGFAVPEPRWVAGELSVLAYRVRGGCAAGSATESVKRVAVGPSQRGTGDEQVTCVTAWVQGLQPNVLRSPASPLVACPRPNRSSH